MRARFVPLVAVLSLVACDQQAAEQRSTPSQAPLAKAERRAEVAKPDWSGAPDRTALEALSKDARDEVVKSPVPVLLPTDSELAPRAIVTVGPVYYAVSSSENGITLTLHGTRLAYQYADIPPAKGDRQLRGASGWVTKESGIWSASWHERGVAYSLDLECADPNDGRCTDDRLLVDHVTRLVYAGGQGALRGGRP